MTLRELTPADVAAFLEFAADFDPDNNVTSVKTNQDYDAFLHSLELQKRGEGLKEGYVRSTNFYLFDDDGRIVARLTYRPELSERSPRTGKMTKRFWVELHQ